MVVYVTPCVGVWIETAPPSMLYFNVPSHPAWVCGLKHTLNNVILLDEDFTKYSVGSYTKIIANPPFSGNQDIDHVRLMYERLEEGGILAAITSPHWKFASEKKCIDFRNWLEEIHGQVFEIGAGKFKDSGTGISTMAIVIKK